MGFITDVLESTFVGDALTAGKEEKEAARAQQQGMQAAIEEQRAGRESFEQRTQPFVDIGLTAANPLMQLLGIGGPAQAGQQVGQSSQPFTPQQLPATPEMIELQNQIAGLDTQIAQSQATQNAFDTGQVPGVPANIAGHMARAGLSQEDIAANLSNINQTPVASDLAAQRQQLKDQLSAMQSANVTQPTTATPTAVTNTAGTPAAGVGQDQLLQQINPLVSFLRQEGFEDIQESAAARGRLGAGGTLQDLTRFNTQLTSTIVPQLQNQRFNQLFNVLGLGQSSAVGQGQAALQTAGNIGNLQTGIGQARASGILGAEAARDQTRSDIAGFLGGFQGGAFSPPPQQFGGF